MVLKVAPSNTGLALAVVRSAMTGKMWPLRAVVMLVTNSLMVVAPTCKATTKAEIISWTAVRRHLAALSAMREKASSTKARQVERSCRA